MQISILGPVEAGNDGIAIPIAGARVRTLLVRLALGYGRPVSAAELIDSIWGDQPPADGSNALQSLVSRLRRALGDAAAVVQVPGGYRLQVRPEDVDAHVFTQAARVGRTQLQNGQAELAAGTLGEALAQWRGPALAELDPLPAAADELAELQLGALEDRIDADIQCGRAGDVIGELEALAAANPVRERLTGLLMDALAGAGRAAEALTAYERLRRYLADQLGTDPAPELQHRHLELLRGQSDGPPRPRRRTNLRAQRTSFLGRADEAKRIADLLEAGRLVSIIGPGGSGKTRLASMVADGLVEDRSDGVWLVELAPVTDAATVAQAVLSSLGLRAGLMLERNQERSATTSTERLLDLLADADCLLVIDNCEHLITAVAELVDQLLGHCPALRVLATSREPLGIDGESLCLLAPLSLPPVGESAADILQWPCVQLFADRAAAVSASFVITDDTVGAVVEIVRRLDGLPLAIELAAARLRVMPVGEIARRLSDRFRLLTGGSRTALPRHRTLHAVVEWSWDLLTASEQRLAERLSIFPSGATVESATAICGQDLPATDDIADLLNRLVDKSLLQVTEASGLRYRMLETIREYGTERLGERGEIATVRATHARFFAALVEEAHQWIRRAEQLPWLRRLETERDNILAALRYLGESGAAAETIDLVYRLGLYWTLVGDHTEAANWLRFALSVPGPSDPRRRAIVEGLATLNALIMTFGESNRDDVERSLAEIDEVGERLAGLDDTGEPFLTMLRPMLAFFADSRDRMFELLEQAIAVDDPWTRATLIMFRASMYENDGAVEGMRADTAVALELFRGLGERWGLASCLSALAALHTMDDDIDAAIEAYLLAGRYLADFGATSDEAFLHLRLSNLYLRRADIAAARREADLVRTAELHSGSRSQRLMADSVYSSIARLVGDLDAMRELQVALATQLEELDGFHPMDGHLRTLVLANLALLELALGDRVRAGVHLRSAYQLGLGTKDMPILSTLATAVAGYAGALGRFTDAATVLGASVQIRGAEDATDPDVAALTKVLRAELGEEFESYYRAGRSLDRAAALLQIDPGQLPDTD